MLRIGQGCVNGVGRLTGDIGYRPESPIRLTPVAHEEIGKGAQQKKAYDQSTDEYPCSKNRFGLILHLYLDSQVSDAEGIEKRPQDKADDQ